MWHVKPLGPKTKLLFASAVKANARSINSLPNPFRLGGAGMAAPASFQSKTKSLARGGLAGTIRRKRRMSG
jgi:hypothetical protein